MPDLAPNLRFSIEWEDPCAAKGDKLRATWCRLAIHIGQTPITRVYDQRAQTVRDAIYCSAYPLAEWFAYNWWQLINEPERSSTSPERHNLRFAREGFALPNLEFLSEGSLVRAVWKSYQPVAAPTQFMGEGFALLNTEDFAAEVRAFIDKVVARLASRDIAQSCLSEEWVAFRETKGEEKEFCDTAGALGLDPFDLDDKKAEEILSVAKILPRELNREFFLAADSNTLTDQSRWIGKCLKQLENYEEKTSLSGKKGHYRTSFDASSPWQRGYEVARKFRSDIKLGNEKKRLSLDKICHVKGGGVPVIHVGNEYQLDGVVRLAPDIGPQVATSKGRENNKNYLLARALCEYLCGDEENSALLTRISSDRQKRNRAFAAELLAPANGIKKLVSGSQITRDEVVEIAAHFGVSEWLIEHQIQNHAISMIEGMPRLPMSVK